MATSSPTPGPDAESQRPESVLSPEEAPVSWRRVMVACAISCAVGCAGCGSQVPAPGSAYGPATSGASGTGPPGAGPSATARPSRTSAGTVPLRAPWPERGILPEDARLLAASQVLDLAAGLLYALVPATLTSGSYSLQVTDLRTGRVRRGRSYPVSGLVLASGHLWVYGSSGRGGDVLLDEADPGTLATVRSVSVPGASDVAGVAVGPAGSVWFGAGRTAAAGVGEHRRRAGAHGPAGRP